MAIDVNILAQQIFSNLSARDGNSDNKIGFRANNSYDNSIWNSFADVAGGKHIVNYIEQDNALKSIRTYLRCVLDDFTKLNQIAAAAGVTISSKENVTEPVQPTEEVVTEPAQPTEEVVTEPVQPTEEVVAEPVQPTEEVVTEPAQPTEEVVTEPAQPTEEVVTEPAQSVKGKTKNNLEYAIFLNEDGSIDCKFQGGSVSHEGQAALAFREGPIYQCEDENGDLTFKFRHLGSDDESMLRKVVLDAARYFEGKTEIYKHLQDKQSNAEELTDLEKRFMLAYTVELQQYGLQMNDNREIEKIPVNDTSNEVVDKEEKPSFMQKVKEACVNLIQRK